MREDNLSCTASSLIAPIARWSAWEPSLLPDGSLSSPDVGFVEPLLRRRLSSLARMTLRVAHDCAQDFAGARFVYASRHGELTRTTKMLEDIAARQIVSPTVFSMSVLNASAGLFSMLQKNLAPASAISAGRSSFGYGLIEACLQLASDPQQPVLYVYADEPVPIVYGEVSGNDDGARAIGLLLHSSATLRVSASISPDAAVASQDAQAQAFLRCLEHGRSDWHDGGTAWCWAREG